MFISAAPQIISSLVTLRFCFGQHSAPQQFNHKSCLLLFYFAFNNCTVCGDAGLYFYGIFNTKPKVAITLGTAS
jgi:hypothetical protein